MVTVCKVHVLSPWQMSSWITPTQWEMLVRKQQWSERPVNSYQLSPKSSFLPTALLSNSLSPLKIRYLHVYVWLLLLCSPPYGVGGGGNEQYCDPSVSPLVLSHVQHHRLSQLRSDTGAWSADLQYLHGCPQLLCRCSVELAHVVIGNWDCMMILAMLLKSKLGILKLFYYKNLLFKKWIFFDYQIYSCIVEEVLNLWLMISNVHYCRHP